MVFKEMIAYLLEGSRYVCSNDIQAEKKLHDGFVEWNNEVHDWIRQRNPDWTDAQVSNYITRTEPYGLAKTTEECLKSHGVDVSQLPHVVVPEFGDVASLILKIGIGGAVIAGAYAANYLRNKGFNYKI